MKREEEKPASVPRADVDKQAGEDLRQRYKAEPIIWSKPMLKALERGPKGNKWFSLIDKVASERTLGIAWSKVQDNAGACGVDCISVAHFAKDSQSRLLAVNEHIKKGSYRAKPIRRVEIPKAGSKETRPLGIPTVTDRVVQTAVKMVIEPIFEREFSPSSYGFRPGVGAKDALREVERLLKDGFTHVVDIDIKGYFDNIPHQPLMRLVKERIADGKVLGLLEGFLRQGVLENGVEVEAEKGSPQGGVISPLLANIYLNPLDWKIQGRDLRLVRYADDIVVLCRSEQVAQQVHADIEQWMEQAGLQLHPEKTRREDMSQSKAYFDFLGYRFQRAPSGKLMRLVRPKSLKKFRDKVRSLTKRCNAHSMEWIIVQLEPIQRGWFGYFKHVERSELSQIDGWVRMRLRSILRKREGKEGRGRGIDHQKWKNDYFANLGFYSLLEARNEYLSLPDGVKC